MPVSIDRPTCQFTRPVFRCAPNRLVTAAFYVSIKSMSLSEFEIKRVENIVGQFVEKIRPNSEIRDKFDISFTIYDQSFEIIEVRPQWNAPI